MRTLRRRWASVPLVMFLLFTVVTPALAGGWATVTLDALPQGLQAGQTATLGFMVRQHGKTPISSVTPLLTARSVSSGETLNFAARQEGPIGHFVVDVTLPSAGTWAWSVTPAPFGVVEVGQVTVLAAGTAQPTAPVVQDNLSNASPSEVWGTVRWLGLLSLFLACGLGLWRQRARFVQRRPLRVQ